LVSHFLDIGLMVGDGENSAALTQFKAWLAKEGLGQDDRLPPERVLCQKLGLTRNELRKVFATLESEGKIWRHVGKGTFLGARPKEEMDRLGLIASSTNPAEMMRARMIFEPAIAAEAAMFAVAQDFDALAECIDNSRQAETWREYEKWDNRLHETIARAARNPVVEAVYETISNVRRAVVWGRLRATPVRPPPDHHSFADHDRIVEAIRERDQAEAGRAMRRHLASVQHHLLGGREAAE
jgi:DNA-binding FadR family transcriptional regulator